MLSIKDKTSVLYKYTIEYLCHYIILQLLKRFITTVAYVLIF